MGQREGHRSTALVTGASSGIGMELAREFASRGFDVALAARRRERLEAAAREIEEQWGGGGAGRGVRAHAVVCDLADGGDVENERPSGAAKLIEDLRVMGVEIDVLVNNAGFGLRSAFAAGDLKTQMEMVRVNVGAVTELARLVLPGMVARTKSQTANEQVANQDRAAERSAAARRGILNVASTAAFVPGPFMAVYFATKAYVESLSVALAEELRGTGVVCTCLCPGPVKTKFSVRAGSENASWFKRATTMSAAEVARAGVDGFMRGRSIVMPGVWNRVGSIGARVLTRRAAARIARGLNGG